MELVTPEIGLIFWTTVVFSLLLVVLKKYAWKPILSAVDERNKSIEEALRAADKAKEEMLSLSADNERILMETKKERDLLLKEGREIKDSIIAEAKDKAKVDAEKILITAKEQIINEKITFPNCEDGEETKAKGTKIYHWNIKYIFDNIIFL